MNGKKADISLILVFAVVIAAAAIIYYQNLCGNLLLLSGLSAAIGLISGLILYSQIDYAGFLVAIPITIFLLIAGFALKFFGLC